MREHLESLLLALGVGSLVAIGAKRLHVAYNVALVIMGLLLVVANVLPKTPLDPELILVVFLPVLVFEGSLFADADSLKDAKRPIFALAAPGVVISLLCTAAIATFALNLSFSSALLLGALLAITDTVSVLLAFRSVRAPHRLVSIMEGESLFNDGTALVLLSVATNASLRGGFSSVEILRSLIVAIIGGVSLGAALGAVGTAILRRTPDHLTTILVSCVLVFTTSLLAERMHISSVIAVVVAGLAVGRAARNLLEPAHVLALQGFWETAGFALNVFLFLLVGMQIHPQMLINEFGSIVVALIALHVGRAVAVYGCLGSLCALTREVIPLRWQHVMVAGNVKGALSMAAVLALPEDVPSRDRLITIVYGVTFITLVTQALPFAKLLNLLKVTKAIPDATLESARAARISARRGQAELDELLASGLISRKDHAEKQAMFQRTIIEADATVRAKLSPFTHNHLIDNFLFQARKAAVLDAARRGLISHDTAHKHVQDLDRTFVHLTTTPDQSC
ncbi:cation:proton antiporter [Pajaroellobacter abortibovis]|uniref:Sodium:proton antiporter n=1 Tax=Pajaroellobacter abortibovis TaxID=1882918 RepID=A0A1L6MZC9_9BACT|nr:sodium:proton antiporter [Pajaroellobacter abortibovis]APS00757.1 sodium:proton antiporter [Pajaroellobacter abortibovis]